MNAFRTFALALIAAPALALAAVPAIAQEHEPIFVCTADQVLPGFGFLPITFSPEIAALFGVDPAECQTPVEP